jgi:hypothetical protein
MRYNHLEMLPEKAFQPIGKRMTLEGKGGGGTSTVSQVQIPKELLPYIKESIQGAQKVAALPYVAYGGQRIAGLTPQQQQSMAGVMGLSTPEQFAQATRGAQSTAGLGYSSAQQGLAKALGYNPQDFGAQSAAQYMSPYQQAVTDIGLRQAQEQALRTKRAADLNAAGTGTYGGARQALLQAQREQDLGQNLADIQAKGSQSAYQAAMEQFNADQARKGQAAQLAGQVGTSGLGTAMTGAQTLGQLGQAQQESNLARLQAQMGVGSQLQQQNQAVLSQRYQDFLEQRGYPKEQASWYSNIVRGLPISPASTQTTTAPAPSTLSQLGGLGVAGLGLYNMMK